MYSAIVSALETLRYTVYKTRREKINPREITCIPVDIDLFTEDTGCYDGEVTVSLRYLEMDVDHLIDGVATLIHDLELQLITDSAYGVGSFEFGKPSIEQQGEAYIVEIECTYHKVINLD